MQLKKKGELEFAVIPAGSTQLEPGDIFTLYHKKHPIRVALIPRPLKSMSDITPGLCVWFKHPGYPYWPARIAMVCFVLFCFVLFHSFFFDNFFLDFFSFF